MRKKHLLAITFVLIGISQLFAQNAKIEFDNIAYDFNSIQEEKGPASHSFKFKNTGDSPLIINQVRASCGCTTPSYSKAPIPPGKEGNIEVTYNPKNRPGAFTKTIRVTSNAQPSTQVLTIRGTVVPRKKTDQEIYTRKLGNINVKYNHISFSNLLLTSKETKTLDYINFTDKPVTIEVKSSPKYLTIKANPTTIKPHEKGVFEVTYDATQRNAYGYNLDRIYLTINGDSNYKNYIGISANLTEDFSKLSAEDLANAPIAKFNETVFNFNEIKQGDKVDHVFKLKNDGKDDLIIRRIRTSCGCTAVAPEKEIIASGEEAEVKVEFNSRGKRGRQNKTVTVITNDPKHSTIYLRVSGNVLVPEA